MQVASGKAVAGAARDVSSRRSGARLLLEAVVPVALALLWIFAWGLGRIQEFAPHASVWFPPAGVTFAAFVVFGPRAAVPVTAASLLITLGLEFHGAGLPVPSLLLGGLLVSAAHAAAYGAGTFAFRRWAGSDVPRAVTVFLLAVPTSALLASLGGAVSLAVSGLIPYAEARAILLPWFIGDFVGVVALAPAVAALLERLAEATGTRTSGLLAAAARLGPARPGLGDITARLLLCCLPLAASLVLLLGFDRKDLASSFIVFFAVVPLMWIVHTEGAIRTFASVAALSIALAGAGALVGPGDHTTAYQFAMIVLAGSAYFGLAVPSLYLDNERLRRLATTDSLTGAMNARRFFDDAARETERARRFGTPLSLILLDLDRFKTVNDTHGHPFGDTVLSETASRLRAGLRDSDVLGRLGGEEFAILLPMTDEAAAAETAKRLADALRDVPVTRGSASVIVTASFGVAAVEPAKGFDATRERADRALYEAKRLGRDRVEVAPPA